MNRLPSSENRLRIRFGRFLAVMWLITISVPAVQLRSPGKVAPSPVCDAEPVLPSQTPEPPFMQSQYLPTAVSAQSTQTPSEPTPPTSSGSPVHILLIGQDRRPGEGRSRSDSMILCTLSPSGQRLTMTSILRDLYVPIPGHGSNRINAAYILGGIDLLEQTLEENLGITLEGSIEVDFQQFADIIDFLGGVQLELRPDEAEYVGLVTQTPVLPGLHTLTGGQALAYARIRKLDSDGDFSRTARQRKMLTALLRSFTDASLSDLLHLPGKLLPMVTTNLSKRQLLTLIRRTAPFLPQLEIRSQCLPAEGTYDYRTVRGMSVLVADMDALRRLIGQTACSSESEQP